MYLIIDPVHLPSMTSNPQTIDLCGVRVENCVYLESLPTGEVVVHLNPDQGGYTLDSEDLAFLLMECGGGMYKDKISLLAENKWLAGSDNIEIDKQTVEAPRFVGVAGEK